jgi:hypothetical protein
MARSFGVVEEKIGEADFFLDRLVECAEQAAFVEARYYFSAFASAARSVTLALQASLSGVEGFSDWYERWRERLAGDPAAKFFLEARNATQKIGLNPVSGGTTVSIGGSLVRVRFLFAPDGFHPELPAPPGDDVIAACRRHLEALVELLRECHKSRRS